MMLVCGLFFAAVSIPSSYAQPDYTYRLHKIVTWTFETHGKPTSPAIPKCLDVLGGNATQASVVGWWDCDKGDEMEHSNQMWHMDKDTGNVHFRNTSLCLDIGGANFSFDAPLQLWQCLTGKDGKPAPQQQWFYSACDSGGEDGPACDHPAIAYGSWASVYAKATNGSYWKVGGMPFEVDPGTANGRLATIWPGSMQTDANVAAIPALSCFTLGNFRCNKVIDGISITVQNQQQEIINGSVSVKPDHVPSRTLI